MSSAQGGLGGLLGCTEMPSGVEAGFYETRYNSSLQLDSG